MLIESWFAANSESIVSLLVVVGLAILAWKTNIGQMLVNVLAIVAKLRIVLVLAIVLVLVVIVAMEVL
jgi:hypothetical protein